MSPFDREKRVQLGYRPSLDGLRAVGVASVMAFHARLPYSSGGFLGVDIFFVLSGFLITALLVQEWERRGSISLKDFYARRALRLLPALLTLLVLLSIYAFLFAAPAKALEIKQAMVATLFYMSNWVRAYRGRLHVLDHTWSLSIEEQFYLLWPPLLYAMLRLKLGRRTILLFVTLGILASAAVQGALWRKGVSAWRLYNGLDTHGQALLLGCAIGLLFVWSLLPTSRRWRAGIRLGAGAATVLLAVLFMTATWDANYMYYGVGSLAFLGAALLVWEVLTAPSRLSVFILEARPVVWIGRISYGLYLWHYPVFRVLTFDRFGASPDIFDLAAIRLQLVRFAVTFAVATCSFYLIEQPMLRLKRRFTPLATPDRPAAPERVLIGEVKADLGTER